MEAIWLLAGLRPKYKTIADFRKNHSKAFREVFRRFVCLLKEWSLVEGETIAIDSLLDAADKMEDKKEIQDKIEERKEKQAKYIRIKEELEQSGKEQISLTDPDSRAVHHFCFA